MKKLIGILLIILGGLGGLVPIIPGFLLFFVGLSFISPTLEKKFKTIYSRYKIHKNLKLASKELIYELTPSWFKN
ncbi:MAG: hypothetical protein ACRDA4_08370 [Filifactoraceae bacterium]